MASEEGLKILVDERHVKAPHFLLDTDVRRELRYALPSCRIGVPFVPSHVPLARFRIYVELLGAKLVNSCTHRRDWRAVLGALSGGAGITSPRGVTAWPSALLRKGDLRGVLFRGANFPLNRNHDLPTLVRPTPTPIGWRSSQQLRRPGFNWSWHQSPHHLRHFLLPCTPPGIWPILWWRHQAPGPLARVSRP